MTPLAISSMVLKPLQSAYTWRRKDKSLLFRYCPAQCPFVVHQRVVKNFSAFVYLRDMGYYRSHFFLGRRENKNVICSVAFNFGLTAFLAVAASLHMKLNLIHFFCSHISSCIWVHCTRVRRHFVKDIHVEKAQSAFWHVVVTPPEEVSILPFLRFICVFWNSAVFHHRLLQDPWETSKPVFFSKFKSVFLL